MITRITVVIIAAIIVQFSFVACKSSGKDADIKTELDKRFKDDPKAMSVIVNVKDGIVTLSGETQNDSTRKYCTEVAQTISFVKSVVNNCKVIDTMATDEELNHQLWNITQDITTIKIAADSGVIHIAGNLRKTEWDTLRMSLDQLRSRGYDTINLRLE